MLLFTSSKESVSRYLESATAWLASWIFVMWRTDAWRTVLPAVPNREFLRVGVIDRFLLVVEIGTTLGAASMASNAGLAEGRWDGLETIGSDDAAGRGGVGKVGLTASPEVALLFLTEDVAWTFGEEGGDAGVDDGVLIWVVDTFVIFVTLPMAPPPPPLVPSLPLSVEFGVMGADGITPWLDGVYDGEGGNLSGWNSSSCPDIINTPFPSIPTSSSNCIKVVF